MFGIFPHVRNFPAHHVLQDDKAHHRCPLIVRAIGNLLFGGLFQLCLFGRLSTASSWEDGGLLGAKAVQSRYSQTRLITNVKVSRLFPFFLGG
jgi:hypothetical protein